VRIGNPTGNNGRPADGFSINFAHNDDPVIYWALQGAANFRGWAGGDSTAQALEPAGYNYATQVGTIDPATCDSGTAENGTKTGVAVQFDTWQGNTIIDQNGATAGGNDNVAGASISTAKWSNAFLLNLRAVRSLAQQPPTRREPM